MNDCSATCGSPDRLQHRDRVDGYAAYIPVLLAFYLVGFLVIFPWGGRDCVGGVDADGDRVEVWAFTGLRQRDLNDPKLRHEVPLVLLYLPFVGVARLFGYQHVLLGGREHAIGC